MTAMYLVAVLEFLCRVRGRYLGKDGVVKRAIPKQLHKKAGLRHNQQLHKKGPVNRIHQAFTLYLYRNSTPLGKRLRKLEKLLTITRRLEKIRNPVMHGELPDPSVEADFFALLIAMFYYAESGTEGQGRA